MDKIIIDDARFLVNIGVTGKERGKKQSIIIYAELYLDTRKAAITNKLKDTADYIEVYEVIKAIAENKQFILIEALANELAKEILKKFDIKKVLLRVKKPSVLQNKAKFAAIEIIRENG